MNRGLLLLALTLFSAPAPLPPSKMTVRDGRVFWLKEPPRLDGNRIVFTTEDGRVYSMNESEVVSIVVATPPPPPPREMNPQDSKALGAIARQQRARKGKVTDLAPATPRRVGRKTAKGPSRRAPPKRTPAQS